MKKYTNAFGTELYKDVSLDSPFDSKLFHPVYGDQGRNKRFMLFTDLGSITVLDRLIGFFSYESQMRDTESGFTDVDGNFWLASGGQDVRESGAKTFGEAIEWIKQRANTSVPKI